MRTLPPNFLELDQQSPEWRHARIGLVTASRIKDAIDRLSRKSKGKEPGDYKATRDRYMKEMAFELLTGKCADHYVSEPMENGIEMEPVARDEYETQFGVTVSLVGLVLHPAVKCMAASPDGIIWKERKLVQFKCPLPITHIGYIANGGIPKEYRLQMLCEMACVGKEFIDSSDFVSFCDEMPEQYKLFRVNLPRDEEADEEIAEMEIEAAKFRADVDDYLALLKERMGGPSVIEQKLRESLRDAELRRELVNEIVP
jgi:YqaJ-like viral recombinase domain